MRDDQLRRIITRPASRRGLLKGAGAASLATLGYPIFRQSGRAATLRQTPPTRDVSGTSLSLLQWSHFVPNYDVWFDQFVAEWGEANGVETTVDHINTADVPAALASEVSAGEGHDLIEHIASLAQYEKSLVDMTDLVEEATARHGEQLPMAKANSFNPTTGVYYGFCHGYAADPANYRKSLWEAVDLPDGPSTFDELLEGGTAIRSDQGVQLGIGMSNEIDSNMAAQAMLWAFGASVQDEKENVVINSPETVAAVEYMKSLFEGAMTPEVFGWNAASNNQLMVAGQASYILNSISAYRTAQKDQPDVAADIFFTPPLEGPGGPDRALAHGHAVFIYLMPTHAQNQDTAREFLLHLVNNYDAACNESELYNFPAFASTVPDLEESLTTDPFGSEPADKLSPLTTANDWTVNLGWPGPANALIGEVFATFVLPNMMAKAARGELSPQDAVAEAEAQILPLAEKWKAEGLIGGGQ
jgi:multiple sugar transport system substrate-binding protein